MLNDLRYAVRTLRSSPGFTIVAMLTLALGIGANAAIFSAINATLLRPLPYRDAGQLVTVDHFYPSLKGLEAGVSAPGFADYRDRSSSFSSVAVGTGWQPTLTGDGDPERLMGASVSADYYRTLGVQPAMGRAPGVDEDQPGRNRVVVIGDGMWRARFGADPAIVGRTINLDGEPHEIVGVMPPGFRDFFNPAVQLWRPLGLTTQQLTTGRTNEWLSLTARLRPGVTVERAGVDLRTLAEQLKQQYPESYPADWTLKVTELREKATGKLRPALFMLLGAVTLVLLIACANVANLLLARAATRSREVALRTALGAQRRRLVAQLLTESVVLALGGGLLGLLLAELGVSALGLLNADTLAGERITLDATVVLFTLGISLLTGLAFGIVPALQVSRPALQATLREGGRGAAGDRGAHRLRRALIISEVALAVVLLAGAGLLIRSFGRLVDASPGFNPENVLTFTVALPTSKYEDAPARRAFFDELLPRLAALPGVRAVGGTNAIPFGPGGGTSSFQVEGYTPAANEPAPWGDFRRVTPGYFQAIGAKLIRGRTFTAQDNLESPRVAIIDEQLARQYWPDQDPIGKRVSWGSIPNSDSIPWREVVGVVSHVKHAAIEPEVRTQLYLPYHQSTVSTLNVAIRTSGDPLQLVPAVRETVRRIDRDQAIASVKPLAALVSEGMGPRRLAMVLLSLFAGLALLIACVGLYGITAYAVTQRTREIGVRMALGARREQVVLPFVRDSVTLAVIGLGIGTLAALAGGKLLASQLYDLSARDPVTLVGTALVLLAVAALASFLPARGATSVDPIVALRAD